MHAEKSNFSIARMAGLLGVSRSGYYAWLDRAPSARAVRRERIEQKVAWFHGESDEVSGSPRILADLRADGEVISRKPANASGCPSSRPDSRGATATWNRSTAEYETSASVLVPHPRQDRHQRLEDQLQPAPPPLSPGLPRPGPIRCHLHPPMKPGRLSPGSIHGVLPR